MSSDTEIIKQLNAVSKKVAQEAKSKNKREKPDRDAISAVLNEYVRDITALRLSFDDLKNSLFKRVDEKAKEINSVIPEKKDGKLEISLDKYYKIMDLTKNLNLLSSSLTMLPQGQILSLVSKWDLFFSSLLRYIFKMQPDSISGSERKLTYSEIASLENIADARKLIVDAEVEGVMRGSHSEQFSYLEKKLSVKLREDKILWAGFFELVQRRHLIAHTGGRVSRQYIDLCRNENVKIQKDTKSGEFIKNSAAYVQDSSDLLVEVGVKIGRIVWTKIAKDELQASDNLFLSITFDLIAAGRFMVAIKLLKFFTAPAVKHFEERSRIVAMVNMAQSYKWNGEDKKCQEILDERDWSVLSDEFRLAEFVLRDKFKEASDLMRKIGRNGVVTSNSYDTWPLFKEFRQDSHYIQAYGEIFGKKVVLPKVDVKELEKSADLTVELPSTLGTP